MNWLPSDQLGFTTSSMTSTPIMVTIFPTLNWIPLPFLVGKFRVM